MSIVHKQQSRRKSKPSKPNGSHPGMDWHPLFGWWPVLWSDDELQTVAKPKHRRKKGGGR
jgi:hypothetical protein